MQRANLCRGFVLHTRAFRDSSLILEAFLRDYGRLALVARGVRGKRPATRARLQPFRELRLSFAGRGELKTLTDSEELTSPVALDGESLICGYYINELLMRLLQHDDEHRELYDAYGQTLTRLASSAELDTPLRLFEHRLLQSVGYGLNLDTDCEGKAFVADADYAYRDGQGFVPASSGTRLRTDQPIARGACLTAMRNGQIPRECSAELKTLLRAALQPYLGDKPLKSRELLSAVRAVGSPGIHQ